MSLRQLQESIAQWGRETFGRPGVPPPPEPIAARMNVEVAELLVGLAELPATPPGSQERQERIAALVEECADIGIMLVQVVDALGGNLEAAMNHKMVKNRARTWERTANGKVQHVEEREPSFIGLGAPAEGQLA